MKNLLIDEYPLQLLPSLAVAIGLNEAIVIQQVHYWLQNSKNKGHEQDGYKWVYNTYADWKETNFPFWSENTIQRIFTSLEEKGLLVSIQPMKGKYDRTKYYRIDYPKLEVFEDTNLGSSIPPKLVSSLNESETTTETTHKSPKIQIHGVANKIFAGQPVEQSDLDPQALEKEATDAFEVGLGVSNPWNWYADEREWKKFRLWVVEQYQKDRDGFKKYGEWRKQPYVKGSMSNPQIRRNPELFPDSFDMYLAHSAMYPKGQDTSRKFERLVRDE